MIHPRAHHPPDWFLATQRLKTYTKLFYEELWLFPGRKVTALGGLVKVDELAVGALSPTPRSLVDLLRKNADGGRNGGLEVVEEGAPVLPIQPSAGHACVRQPGKGNVVEDVVPCNVTVGLSVEKELHDVPVAGHVVVDHPGSEGDG